MEVLLQQRKEFLLSLSLFLLSIGHMDYIIITFQIFEYEMDCAPKNKLKNENNLQLPILICSIVASDRMSLAFRRPFMTFLVTSLNL